MGILQRTANSSLIRHIAYLMPFSPRKGILWHFLDKQSRTILDVGCEKGGAMQPINFRDKKTFRVGLDIFLPYLKYSERKGIYDDCILADVRYLPLRNETFDTILCIHTIEHLPKVDGWKLIRDLEKIARRQVIFSCPVGMYELKDAIDGNIFQRHKSGWRPDEFKKLGYKVRGESISFTQSFWLSYILPLTCLVYFNPEKASSMICTKKLAL